MKQLHFQYSMKIDFSCLIEKHRFTVKCFPPSNDRQQIQNQKLTIFPNQFLSRGKDSFGNEYIYGYTEEQHNHFSIELSGNALTGLKDTEYAGDITDVGLYKYQTDYTRPGPALTSYRNAIGCTQDNSNLAKAKYFMEHLHKDFPYVQGVTSITTTAEEAMMLGSGVCQDYSHILLSLCRMERIPARYVVGMMVGEGLSHAWAEVFENGYWIALDPTNLLVVDDQHIKLSNGRDYKDCTINQGVFYGNALQTQNISVVVKEDGGEHDREYNGSGTSCR